jgi:hypothetical protein
MTLRLVTDENTATASSKPIIRAGDALVNVTDYNGPIKRADLVTSSPASGKGMRAGQSGYVLGVALEDASFGTETVSVAGRTAQLGTVKVALRIEYAELNSSRNAIHFFDDLNAALFANLKDPEKFTNTVRTIVAGIISVVAFTVGFVSINRSVIKTVEAVGRNPLAKVSILSTLVIQLGVVAVGALFTIFIVFLLLRF